MTRGPAGPTDDAGPAAAAAAGPAPVGGGGPDRAGSGPGGADRTAPAAAGAEGADRAVPGAARAEGSDRAVPAAAGAAGAEWTVPGAAGADRLDSGPERPPRRASRRWLRVAAVGVAAGAAVLAVRAGTKDEDSRPVAPAEALPARPTPPYDREPGRTPIPAPSRVAGRLAGALPELGGPDRRAARRSAELVAGRYCAVPARYTFSLDGGPDWREVRVFLVDLERSDGPVRQWGLTWTGRSYRWTGPVSLLEQGC